MQEYQRDCAPCAGTVWSKHRWAGECGLEVRRQQNAWDGLRDFQLSQLNARNLFDTTFGNADPL